MGIVITTCESIWFVYGANVMLVSSCRRPEVMESNFYAWRATGDRKYYDRAVATYKAFQAHLPAPVGYAGIDDVRQTDSKKIDDCESFWFAEVLK
jgi:mannosyl-oligosaccharide alpha-1,2-mannosidase